MEGATAATHGWEGPGAVGAKMPSMIGYHNKGPGAWADLAMGDKVIFMPPVCFV